MAAHRSGTRAGTTAWILQAVLAALFTWQGILKFAVPDNLPSQLEWVYDMSEGLRAFVGVVELLAAAGLILPAVTGILRWLTPVAAAGLVALMIGAAIWHVPREGETQSIVFNLVVAAAAAVIVYLRRDWLPGRGVREGA